MNKLLLYLLLLMSTLSVAYASDWGYTNDTIQVWSNTYNGTTNYNCSQVNITILDPNNTAVVVNKNMSLVSTGVYKYTFVPNSSGVWYTSAICYGSNSSQLGIGSQSFAIMDNIPIKTVGVLEMIFEPFLTFAVGFLLVLLGYYMFNYVIVMLGGVWFLGVATSLAFTSFKVPTATGISTFTFFALLGLSVILFAVVKVTEQREERKSKRFKQDGDSID